MFHQRLKPWILIGAVCLLGAVYWLWRPASPSPSSDQSDISVSGVATADDRAPDSMPVAAPVVRDPQQLAVRLSSAIADERRATSVTYVAPEDRGLAPEDPIRPSHAAFRENNRKYIHEILWPRVQQCWDGVEGDGTIIVEHNFAIVDGVAIPTPSDDADSSITLVDSTLPPGEDEKALDCLRRSAEGTSYEAVPLRAGDELGDGRVLYQSWHSRERLLRLAKERE